MIRWLSAWRPMRNGSGSSGMRLRRPLGSITTRDAGSGTAVGAVVISLANGGTRGFGGALGRLGGGGGAHFFHLARAQRLAMGAIAPHLGAGQQDLEAEVALDLLPETLQRFAEKLFHLAAAE